MSRLLFLVVAIIIVYWLLKSYRKQFPGEGGRGEDASGQAEDMVRCAHCGVHLPKHESIMAEGKRYCSEEHRRMHTGKSE